MTVSKGKVLVWSNKSRRMISIGDIIEGVKGEKGLQGPQGVQGERGPIGPKGDKGDTGEQGVQGVQGLQGEGLRIDLTIDSVSELETNPAVQTLPHGSLILIADPNDVDQIDNGKVYVVHDNGPVYSFSMAGKEGLQGEQGIQGVQGVKGDKGDKGDVGERGEQGLQGPQGPEGLKGERGEQGTQGIQGVQGAKGDKGDKGDDAPLKGYLYGKRGSPQTITKAGDVVLFDTSFLSRDISYNASNGQFVLLADKVYRITFTTGIAFTSTNGFVSFALTDNTGTQLEQTTGLFSNIASAHNGAGNYLLDIVYRPTVNTNCTISVHEITAGASYLIRSGYTSLVIQEL